MKSLKVLKFAVSFNSTSYIIGFDINQQVSNERNLINSERPAFQGYEFIIKQSTGKFN